MKLQNFQCEASLIQIFRIKEVRTGLKDESVVSNSVTAILKFVPHSIAN